MHHTPRSSGNERSSLPVYGRSRLRRSRRIWGSVRTLRPTARELPVRRLITEAKSGLLPDFCPDHRSEGRIPVCATAGSRRAPLTGPGERIDGRPMQLPTAPDDGDVLAVDPH